MTQQVFKPQILAFFNEKFPICTREHEHSIISVRDWKFHVTYINEIKFKCKTCCFSRIFFIVGIDWNTSIDVREI